jgi:hypothetical protein
MSDKNAIQLFKIVGILQVLAGLFYLCIVAAVIVGLAGVGLAESSISEVGETSGVDYEGFGLAVAMTIILSVLAMVLYFASAFGFFKLKTWQPTVFAALLVLSVVSMIYNLVAQGFSIGGVISAVSFLIGVAIMTLVWKKKSLFAN